MNRFVMASLRAALLIFLLSSGSAALAQAQAQAQVECNSSSGQAQVDACTRDINSGRFSGRELSNKYVIRGLGYESLQKFDEAFANYEQAILVDPKNAYAYANRGDMHLLRGEQTRAFGDFSTAIQIEPNNALNWNARCWALTRSNIDLKRALEDCTRAIELNSKYWQFYSNRAFANLRLSNFDQAISDSEIAIKLRPKSEDAYYLRGLARLRKGDTAGGEADVAEAERLRAGVAKEYEGYGLKR